jgi:hypothetical protein
LHESYIRFSVRVNNNARVRLTTNTSAARYSISALECASVEEAIAAIVGARQVNDSVNKGVNDSGTRLSRSLKAPESSRSQKARSSEGT